MESLFSMLYLAMQQRLLSICSDPNDASTNIIRFIDHDLGQLQDEVPAIAYPAAFIDMGNFTFQSIGENCQTFSGPVMIRLVFKRITSSGNLTPVVYKEKALSYYEVEELIHMAFQGWSPSYVLNGSEQVDQDIFGSFDRSSARTDKRREDLRIREIGYSIAGEDYGTMRTQLVFPITPNTVINIIPQLEINADLIDL